jgi:succinate dehydrogenase / fumarate reductase cytochrome b subunit
MNWLVKLFSSSLGKKMLMSLTGIFLLAFLLVHLAGNLQLLKPDGGKAFNEYAHFMGTNPLIQIVSKVNFIIIIFHIVWAVILSISNRKARGPVAYKKKDSSATPWSSRNMVVLGLVMLAFIVIHLRHFWAETHYGNMDTVQYDGKMIPNLYALVAYWFSKTWYVSFYVFTMIAASFHLWHGIPSLFQTLGINHSKYNFGLMMVGKSMAILIPGIFALIPLMMYISIRL